MPRWPSPYKRDTCGTYNCYRCGCRCDLCRSAELRQRKRYESRHNSLDRSRERALRNLYGITPDDYDRIFERQNGVCAICHKPCSSGKHLAVDHNHVTGRVRGLLCSNCNGKLGWLEMYQPVVLNYLIEHS